MGKQWKTKERRYIYKANTPDEISVAIDRILLPSGNEFDYVYVDCPYQVVYIVGLNNNDQVLMLRQYRYLIGEELWEVPAGSPNPGESLEQGAHREFEEEAGYKADSLVKLASFYSSVGLTNQVCHVYLATGLRKSSQQLEEAELIRVYWMQLDQAIEMVRNGQITNIGAAYGLLLTESWLRTRSSNQVK